MAWEIEPTSIEEHSLRRGQNVHYSYFSVEGGGGGDLVIRAIRVVQEFGCT